MKHKIVICLDLDNVFSNSKGSTAERADINGSNHYNDASAWLNFIQRMQRVL